MSFHKITLTNAQNASFLCEGCHQSGYNAANYAVAHRAPGSNVLQHVFHLYCIQQSFSNDCMSLGLTPMCKTCGLHITHVNGVPVRDPALNTPEFLILEAVQGGDLAQVQNLRDKISMESRGEAVCNAARYGHADMIRALLQDNAQISVEARGLAVINATEDAEAEVIEILLNNGPIADEDRFAAIELARANNDSAVQIMLAGNSASETA